MYAKRAHVRVSKPRSSSYLSMEAAGRRGRDQGAGGWVNRNMWADDWNSSYVTSAKRAVHVQDPGSTHFRLHVCRGQGATLRD